MELRRVLLVQAEDVLGAAIRETLASHGCQVVVARSAAEAEAVLGDHPMDAALVDLALPDTGGLDLLRRMKRDWSQVEVVLMSSESSLDLALQAMREGAYDYLVLPLEAVEDVWTTVNRALEKSLLTQKNRAILRVLTEQNRELAESVRRLTSLIEASRAIGEFESQERILEFFTDLVCKELDVDRLSLMLIDRRTGELLIAAHRGLDHLDVTQVRVAPGHGIAGKVAQDAEPVLVEDVRNDPRVPGAGQYDLSNSFISVPLVLSVPIMSHAKVLGVLNVASRRTREPFTQEDLDYVQGMASQIAVSVESARRFEELQGAYDSLRAAQNQLVASERLQAVGQMAAGVAHDFNNALAVILGRTETCLLRLDAGEEMDRDGLRMDLEAITKTALQGAETIRRVQDFTRIRRDTPHGRVDMNQVVRDAIEMTRPKWRGEAGSRGKAVEIVATLGDAPPVRGNPHELSQVLNNLIFNAVEAMPGGGRIDIRTFHEGELVVTEVVDTGLGMDQETCRRVFEPFFTTKETGNGLGMSIVYGIVERHDGRISVESTPGKGSAFRVELPVATGADDVPAETAESTPEVVHARILLVDDDEIVRQTIQQTLEARGHRVVAAASGPLAARAFEPDRFDLVITDFNMPGMSGTELAGQLRARDRDVPVILLSGWAVLEEEEEIRRAGIGFTLPKPCPADVLQKTIHAALASRGRDL